MDKDLDAILATSARDDGTDPEFEEPCRPSSYSTAASTNGSRSGEGR